MKILLKFGFIMLLVLVAAQRAYAGIPTVSVSPVTKTVTLSKGETKSGTFVVYNNSDKVLHVKVEPRHWHMVEENKDIPLEAWLEIAPLEFDIGPKGEKGIEFNVTAPEDVTGELAAMIAFKPKPEEEQPINIVFSVSLYVIVLGTEKVDYNISDFKIWKFEDKKALSIKLDLKNTGNVHLKPKTTVFIQDIFNKNLQKAVLRYGKPTYPGRVQDYHGAIYNFRLKPGLYKAMIDVEFTNVSKRFRKKVYFLIGKNGKPIFTFFRRPKL